MGSYFIDFVEYHIKDNLIEQSFLSSLLLEELDFNITSLQLVRLFYGGQEFMTLTFTYCGNI